ncbi:hypothetical protein LCGC14_2097170, partial [marine sediment metagenome]
MPEREYDPTLQSPSERRSLLSQGILRLRRLFVQVANVVTLRTDTITERTPGAGVTVDGVLLKDSSIAGAAVPATHSGSTHHAQLHAAAHADGAADTLAALTVKVAN